MAHEQASPRVQYVMFYYFSNQEVTQEYGSLFINLNVFIFFMNTNHILNDPLPCSNKIYTKNFIKLVFTNLELNYSFSLFNSV